MIKEETLAALKKFNEQFQKMRSLRPILLHGLGYFEHTGMKNIEIVDFNLANNLIKKCNSPHYALHLSIKNADMYEGMTDENIPQDRVVFDHYPYIMPEQFNRLIILHYRH